MSGLAEVRLRLGPDEHLFRLGIGELRRVDAKCDVGPLEQLTRFQSGTWRVDDVREPILQGLIGGGMEPEKAGELVEEWVDKRPLAGLVPLAFAVLSVSVMGAPDEPLGEDEAGGAEATSPSREESSASAP